MNCLVGEQVIEANDTPLVPCMYLPEQSVSIRVESWN